MYLKKTILRLDEIRNLRPFKDFFSTNITINSLVYKSLDDIIDILKRIIPDLLYDVKSFSIIHGDLCFSNIMIDSNFQFVKVIDPRGKFGKYDIYGDPRYDLAKLFHSVDGKYDFIIKDLFTVEYDIKKCVIDYEIIERDRDFNLLDMLKNVFKEEIYRNVEKIELIEALLFLSMIPLHTESVNHQMVMLATGLDILNRVENIRELKC